MDNEAQHLARNMSSQRALYTDDMAMRMNHMCEPLPLAVLQPLH